MSDEKHEFTTDQAEREASGAHTYGRYLEEFEVGAIYKHWPAKTVTESDDHLFCLITMNHHPLHINDVYAKQLPAGPQRRRRPARLLAGPRHVGLRRLRQGDRQPRDRGTEPPEPGLPRRHALLRDRGARGQARRSRSSTAASSRSTPASSTRTASSSPSSSAWSWSPARTPASSPHRRRLRRGRRRRPALRRLRAFVAERGASCRANRDRRDLRRSTPSSVGPAGPQARPARHYARPLRLQPPARRSGTGAEMGRPAARRRPLPETARSRRRCLPGQRAAGPPDRERRSRRGVGRCPGRAPPRRRLVPAVLLALDRGSPVRPRRRAVRQRRRRRQLHLRRLRAVRLAAEEPVRRSSRSGWRQRGTADGTGWLACEPRTSKTSTAR